MAEQEMRANSRAPRRLSKGLIISPQVRDRWIPPRDADTELRVFIPTRGDGAEAATYRAVTEKLIRVSTGASTVPIRCRRRAPRSRGQ